MILASYKSICITDHPNMMLPHKTGKIIGIIKQLWCPGQLHKRCIGSGTPEAIEHSAHQRYPLHRLSVWNCAKELQWFLQAIQFQMLDWAALGPPNWTWDALGSQHPASLILPFFLSYVVTAAYSSESSQCRGYFWTERALWLLSLLGKPERGLYSC